MLGVAGIGGNKGGVGIAFHFGATTLSFVSCHLAARAERRAKRSNMYHEICGNLNLGKKSKYSSFDLSHRFHYIFFLGDLNYRLEAGYESVLQQIRSCNYNELLKSDQLKQEQDAGNIFHGYKEGCIQFPPTYRYRRGARDDYIYAKLKPTGNVYNVPSYCDRILSHSFPHMKCNQTGYFCNLMFKASDHAPVIATYDIRVKHQYLWNRCENADGMEVGQSTKIKFPIIEARIKSRSGESSTFYLKLFSYLFEETVHSKPSPSLRADFSRTLMAPDIHASFCNSNVSHWSQADIPEIDPILPYIGYISNEYILIQIRSCSSDELYGQGVLSLQDKFNTDSERMFAIPLTCNELLCGELRGVVVLQGGNTAGMDDKVSFSDQITSPNTGAWIRDGSLSRVYR